MNSNYLTVDNNISQEDDVTLVIEDDTTPETETEKNIDKSDSDLKINITDYETDLKKEFSKTEFDIKKRNTLSEPDLKKEENKPNKNKTIFIIKKIIIYTLNIIIFLSILYLVYNILFVIYEKKQVSLYQYGTEMEVNGHKMIVDIKGASNNSTIIFLTGFMIPSPVLYYKPLTQLLSETYKVITIEPFGYGLSDIVDEERTIENITAELHSCIKQLDLKNYYLMAHSLGGMYSLYYANKFSDEVTGFIGFDDTVPKFGDDDEQLRNSFKTQAEKNNRLNFIGYNRVKSITDETNLLLPLYNAYNYTEEEIDRFRIIELSKGFNTSVRDEGARTTYGLDVIRDMKFPKNMTILHFLSDQYSKEISNYHKLHDDVGSESVSNEVVVLPGEHLDFLFHNNDKITKKLNDFIIVKKEEEVTLPENEENN
ncbi:hypothetical protein PIROE2DRAFT_59627 [Piromyces sp. E2]|nr:hypothetical protein PIROE2DRAFT_59627 [Piromyces sp. E2]|eukprot:OUM66059.1 hypothetical protein PIROE2DRAFT_59627 [Piromyces sp. E2]